MIFKPFKISFAGDMGALFIKKKISKINHNKVYGQNYMLPVTNTTIELSKTVIKNTVETNSEAINYNFDSTLNYNRLLNILVIIQIK